MGAPVRSAAVAKNDEYEIQSLARGIKGLEYVARHGSIRASTFAKVIGTNRSTSFRLLKTLERYGYLWQNEKTKAFFPQYDRLFSLIPPSWAWVQLAESTLQEICDTSLLTANIGIIDDGDVVYIRSIMPQDSSFAYGNIQQGSRQLSFETALGRAILAFRISDSAVDSGSLRKLVRGRKTSFNEATLRKHLSEIRRCQYAIDDEGLVEGLRCVAAPILDCQHNAIAAMSVSGSTSSITTQRLPDLARQLMTATKHVSDLLIAAEYSCFDEKD